MHSNFTFFCINLVQLFVVANFVLSSESHGHTPFSLNNYYMNLNLLLLYSAIIKQISNTKVIL